MSDLFCGWYFKCQSEGQTLALIPAVHAFGGRRSGSVQLITEDGNWSVPIPGEAASVERGMPRARLGNSRFDETGLELDLRGEALSAAGRLHFRELTPIRYDIMGPFRFLPRLECRHSVVSMRHRVDGLLRVNGTDYHFDNAVGYIEGDRGRSFPRRYVWSQCSFDGGALMLSAAEIPLGPVSFTGVISVVLWQGREYRLATYLGARAVRIRDGEVVLRQGDMTLSARLLEAKAQPLRAPEQGAMSRTIRESVACRARYLFQAGGRTLFDFESGQAAFEYEYPQ